MKEESEEYLVQVMVYSAENNYENQKPVIIGITQK